MRLGLRVLLTCSAVGITLAFAPVQAREPPAPSRICYGALCEGKVISYVGSGLDVTWYFTPPQLGRPQTLSSVLPDEGAALQRINEAAGGEDVAPKARSNVPDCWRASHGFLWAGQLRGLVGGYSPIMRLRFPPTAAAPENVDRVEHSVRALLASLGVHNPVPYDVFDDSMYLEVFAFDALAKAPSLVVIARCRFLLSPAIRYAGSGRGWAYRDLFPLSRDRLLLFELTEKTMTVWDLTMTPSSVTSLKNAWRGRWRALCPLPSPFEGPFHVAAAQNRFFFVTSDGAVYVAGKGKEAPGIVPVFKDASHPIIAMLVRAEDGSAVVFGKDFYFPLARQVRVRPGRDVTQGNPELGEPMRTVLQCARVLHQKGELVPAGR